MKLYRERTSDLEYGDPGESDVVEGDGATVWIAESRLADGVVLVPVDAGHGRRRRRIAASASASAARLRPVARLSVLRPQWDVFVAARHSVVSLLATDEVHAVRTDVRVTQRRPVYNAAPF